MYGLLCDKWVHMISESSLVLRVLEGGAKFFKLEHISTREKVNVYVTEVLGHVKKVIDSDGIPEHEVDYSHEVVKELYCTVARSIGDIVSSNDLAKIRQALAAARVYYWVRRYKGRPGTEIIEVINDRISRINLGEVRHNSNEYIIKKIVQLENSSPPLVEQEIEQIYANCLADIAVLENLHLGVVKSKLRRW